MDEDADARIAVFLRARGHAVQFSRDLLQRGSPDHMVAAAAERLVSIVVTRNYRHFRRLIRRATPGQAPLYAGAGLICFRFTDAIALPRIEALIEAIEAEHRIVQLLPDARLIIEITDTTMQTVR